MKFASSYCRPCLACWSRAAAPTSTLTSATSRCSTSCASWPSSPTMRRSRFATTASVAVQADLAPTTPILAVSVGNPARDRARRPTGGHPGLRVTRISDNLAELQQHVRASPSSSASPAGRSRPLVSGHGRTGLRPVPGRRDRRWPSRSGRGPTARLDIAEGVIAMVVVKRNPAIFRSSSRRSSSAWSTRRRRRGSAAK